MNDCTKAISTIKCIYLICGQDFHTCWTFGDRYHPCSLRMSRDQDQIRGNSWKNSCVTNGVANGFGVCYLFFCLLITARLGLTSDSSQVWPAYSHLANLDILCTWLLPLHVGANVFMVWQATLLSAGVILLTFYELNCWLSPLCFLVLTTQASDFSMLVVFALILWAHSFYMQLYILLHNISGDSVTPRKHIKETLNCLTIHAVTLTPTHTPRVICTHCFFVTTWSSPCAFIDYIAGAIDLCWLQKIIVIILNWKISVNIAVCLNKLSAHSNRKRFL